MSCSLFLILLKLFIVFPLAELPSIHFSYALFYFSFFTSVYIFFGISHRFVSTLQCLHSANTFCSDRFFFVTSGCFSRASWINFEFLFTLFWCNIFHFRGLGFSVWVVATFSNRFWKYWAIDQRPLKYLQTTTGFVYLHLVVWRQGHLHLSRDCLWKAVSTAFMCVLSVCTSIFICLGRPFNVSGLKYPQRISDKLLLGIYL